MPSISVAHASVLEADSHTSFLAALVSYAHRLGFGTADATAFVEPGGRPRIINNIPASTEWLALDPSLGQRCPVMQHCKRHGTPVAWGRQTYRETAGVTDLYDVCSSLGLSSGISVAMHLPRGQMLQVSLHTDLEMPSNRYQPLLADFVQFSACATAAAADLFLQLDEDDLVQDLTAVELELLRRVAGGQTIERVAHHLHLAESVTQEVAAVASRTLGCPSIQTASMRALRLGII